MSHYLYNLRNPYRYFESRARLAAYKFFFGVTHHHCVKLFFHPKSYIVDSYIHRHGGARPI